MTTIEHHLRTLHDHYVEAVNMAVAHDDIKLVDRLSASYDAEALALMQEAQRAA